MENIEINTIEDLRAVYDIIPHEDIAYIVFNNYGDRIAMIYKRSGTVLVREGHIFNYLIETRQAIKKNGVNRFFN